MSERSGSGSDSESEGEFYQVRVDIYNSHHALKKQVTNLDNKVSSALKILEELLVVSREAQNSSEAQGHKLYDSNNVVSLFFFTKKNK